MHQDFGSSFKKEKSSGRALHCWEDWNKVRIW